jgi:hypothetical protein
MKDFKFRSILSVVLLTFFAGDAIGTDGGEFPELDGANGTSVSGSVDVAETAAGERVREVDQGPML